MSKHIIPAVLAAADILAAIVCLAHHDLARAFYWFAAGQITVASILMRS